MDIPIKVVVDRRYWFRGSWSGSFLLRNDGQKCCLGFACEALGVPTEDLIQQATPVSLRSHFDTIARLIERYYDGDDTAVDRPATNLAMNLNDDPTITDADREARLIALGPKLGLEFVFMG